MHPWWSWFNFFLILSAFSLGSLPSHVYRANSGRNKVNTGCCDVCGEWLTMCGAGVGGHSWSWASGAIFFLAGWDVLRGPAPPPRPHLLSHDNQTNGFHCRSHWPLALGLWAALRRGSCLTNPPGSITFSPEAAKALSCSTPVVPSL